jgi:PleD family two-component response regulator
MDNVNGGTEVRISNWTLATETQPGHRDGREGACRSVRRAVVRPSARRTVAVVSSQPHPPAVLDAFMKGSEYDVVFVELTSRAYSSIRRVTPDLVVLCLLLDDVNAFHVLSMLKLDSATSSIPVVTYEMTGERPSAVRMN